MTSVDDMPKTGYLLLSVYFNGYQDNFQNDTRRKMGNWIPNQIKGFDKNINLEAIDFSLIRGVVSVAGVRGGTKARGAQQLYRYETPGLEQLKELCNKLAEYSKNEKMWKRYDVYFVDKIWGI